MKHGWLFVCGGLLNIFNVIINIEESYDQNQKEIDV